MAGPATTYKVDLTKNVANFERLAADPAALGKTVEDAATIGRIVYDGLQATAPWNDTSWGLFDGQAYDSWSNLSRRLAEARALVINASRGWQPPPPPRPVEEPPSVLAIAQGDPRALAAAGELVAEDYRSGDMGRRASGLLAAAGDAAGKVVDKVTLPVALVGGAVVVLVVAAVFFRVRG